MESGVELAGADGRDEVAPLADIKLGDGVRPKAAADIDGIGAYGNLRTIVAIAAGTGPVPSEFFHKGLTGYS
nr:hypothetical protein KitaXyl93_27660 [Kitasatospora sp. Xyl93]